MGATMHGPKNAHLTPEKRSALQQAITSAERTRAGYASYPLALLPVQVAQFLLESNWGKSDCGGARNYFGIKARAGEPAVERQTWEVIKGKNLQVMARFRRFESMEECFREHARLLCERRWASGALIYAKALQHPADPIRFAHALTGVYATDPQYGAKLESVMRSRGLLETFGFSV